jgi:replicative DNA helicase
MASNNSQVLELEKKFLAYLLSDKLYIGQAMSKMKRSYFVNIRNIYIMVTSYYEKYKGIISDDTMERQFVKHNLEPDEMIRLKTIISEARTMILIDEADFHAIEDELIGYYKRRQALKMAEEIISANPNSCSEDSFEEMLEKIQKTFVKIQSTDFDVEREGAVDEDAQERLDEYKYYKEHPEEVKLIKTGYKHIDEAIIGWGYGTTNFIAGRKGDGKSTLMLNLAYHVWKQGINVLFFSLEIDKKQYERRWDARAAMVESRGLKSGTLSDSEEKVYEEYIEALKKNEDVFGNKVGKVYIVDCPSAVTPSFIESKTKEIERKTNVIYDFIVVDYAGIMSANNPTGVARDDLGQISLDLKHFARDNNKIVISAVQMNREGKKDGDQKNGRTDTTAIAGSDQIADHCDNAMTIRSIDDTNGIIESMKTRDGASFKFSIEKQYNKLKVVEVDDDGWESL